MKKTFILIPMVLLGLISQTWAQKKDSVTVAIDYFDAKTGDKYGFEKKFDHIPTHNDSVRFRKESSITMRKMIDSIARKEALPAKYKRKKKDKINPKSL
ncbi:hypothetical protein [Mucilaginibacter sp.]|jgi:hypothetical protein|uniref:hypothetical protein n=1 Tax=Mucilaginibacter sp. TaxID=1882438 RepID=UPI002BAE6DF2|nr:hypothetical protein [Mucilaginibacter sp.]HTI60764.1 hypothetical protein [Mucilaginibacter sp.]